MPFSILRDLRRAGVNGPGDLCAAKRCRFYEEGQVSSRTWIKAVSSLLVTERKR